MHRFTGAAWGANALVRSRELCRSFYKFFYTSFCFVLLEEERSDNRFLSVFDALAYGPDLWSRPATIKKEISALIIGALASIAVSGLFNYFRFQSFVNQSLLSPLSIVHKLSQHFLFFLALLFSPNGGILFFWFPFACLFIFFLLTKRRGIVVKFLGIDFDLNQIWKSGMILAFFGLVIGFSRWFAPFGWVAWGPRLLVPWIPSISVLIFTFYANELMTFLMNLRKKPVLLFGLALLLCLFCLPQYTIQYTLRAYVHFFSPNLDCSAIAYIDRDPAFYYSCLNHLMWPRHVFVLKDSLKEAMTPRVILLSLGYLSCILGLFAIAVFSAEEKFHQGKSDAK